MFRVGKLRRYMASVAKRDSCPAPSRNRFPMTGFHLQRRCLQSRNYLQQGSVNRMAGTPSATAQLATGGGGCKQPKSPHNESFLEGVSTYSNNLSKLYVTPSLSGCRRAVGHARFSAGSSPLDRSTWETIWVRCGNGCNCRMLVKMSPFASWTCTLSHFRIILHFCEKTYSLWLPHYCPVALILPRPLFSSSLACPSMPSLTGSSVL